MFVLKGQKSELLLLSQALSLVDDLLGLRFRHVLVLRATVDGFDVSGIILFEASRAVLVVKLAVKVSLGVLLLLRSSSYSETVNLLACMRHC